MRRDDVDAEVAITQLRWTRSDPPGRASGDQGRREVYCAALQQFEELLNAARVAGPASRPLPLFYALSQAGRAIVAAHGEDPETYGHGLTEVRDKGESTHLLHRRLRRRASRGGHDTFGAVARATRSGDFDGEVELGALWVANPHAPRLALEHWLPPWRLALLVVDENAKAPSSLQLHEHARLLRVLPFSEPVEATAEHGVDVGPERYPTIPDHAGGTFVPHESPLGPSWDGYVIWRSDLATLDEVAPRTTFDDDRYLLPCLPGQTKLLSPLLLWWALLYGFSVFARYNPQLWIRALDVDRSTAAVGIEHLMSTALATLPALVYDAVMGKFFPIPPEHRLAPQSDS